MFVPVSLGRTLRSDARGKTNKIYDVKSIVCNMMKAHGIPATWAVLYSTGKRPIAQLGS